ncbi:hypothetical protein N656DRAFT_780386 [Canariomyces notabilis]|uniref:Uncharacterized protein n=1 Tax=Canariomyces notabilis TaxID=2074819 RepID=A0AAN6TC80_9PEZI|nr:hypothetical protein N656DRAFT_780386 [Canariomyces arenarius]
MAEGQTINMEKGGAVLQVRGVRQFRSPNDLIELVPFEGLTSVWEITLPMGPISPQISLFPMNQTLVPRCIHVPTSYASLGSWNYTPISSVAVLGTMIVPEPQK